MPQFDPTSFPSQLFWLVVTFVILYVLISRFAIPRIGDVMEQRQKMMDDDLDRAAQLKAEAETAVQTYEKALADARAKAHEVMKAATDEMSRKAEERNREVAGRLAQQIADGEARIGKARDEALASVREVATGAAQAIAIKLADVSLADDKVDAAVGAALQESR
ncbi:MAG: F0F1 ATP synthase subunit B' [Caenispirillum bisanense]|nr:F0F1 ATP synthase subunit B' [Caenispirillum bisanense]MCA1974283.1 F0F1 ATP synthase subunit B' [Caenispirillum sp.]